MKKILLLVVLCFVGYRVYQSRFWITEAEDRRNAAVISQQYLSALQKEDYRTAISLFPAVAIRVMGGVELAVKKAQAARKFHFGGYTLEAPQKIPASHTKIYAVPVTTSERADGSGKTFHSFVLAFRFSNQSNWQLLDGTDLKPDALQS